MAGPALTLYALTLALELPGAAARWLLFGLFALVPGYLLSVSDPDLIAAPVALLAALGPLLWSLAAFAHPGYGLFWRWRSGGRQLSAREREAYDDALALENEREARPRRLPRRVFVLDTEEPQAAVRGDVLMLSRGLLQRGGANLAAVLAHELGHTSSLDGRLTEALNRLLLWGDPVGPRPRPPVVVGDPVVVLAFRAASVLSRLVRGFWRLLLWLAGGGLAQLLLGSLWAAFWRRREYAADAFAEQLGQGDELARFLDSHALFFDVPVPFLWASDRAQPPVELRIDRLRQPALEAA
jgi:Zn-dependent protease with chaperone function